MIQTSDRYKEGIKADSELVKIRAELSFTPPGATEGVEVSTTTAKEVSKIDQLKNGSFGMDLKWGTLEHGRIILDGGFSFIPRENESQIGFFSDNMCGADGVFAEHPQVTYTFDKPYDIVGVSIAFDDLAGEWATEFDVSAYDASGALIGSHVFQNESGAFYDEVRFHEAKRMIVSVRKWNVGNRYCKISQIVPGIVLSFASEGIFEFDFEESISPFESSVKMPETRMVFDNSDGEFNIINPNGLISFLRQKMKTVPKLDLVCGSRVESIGMGQFYLYEFPKTDQADSATITCRPSIAFETGNYVNAGRGLQTVEDAVNILFANVSEPVEIDEELKSIKVNQYIGDDIPILSAMAQLAVACCGYWKFERDGSYKLKKWKLPEQMTNAIDYDNMWDKPSVEMGERYTECESKYFAWDSTKKRLTGTDITVSAEENDGTKLSISSYFICNEAQAREVAQTYMAYKNLRLSHSVSYRGDMSIEASDGVTIQNDYEHSRVIVMTHKITFDTSGLTGSITGRGLN